MGKKDRQDTANARVIYAAPANLCHNAAHNIHIVRMCEALAQEGYPPILAVRDAPDFRRIAEDYDLSVEFELRRAGRQGLPLFSLSFALSVLRLSKKSDVIVTRNLPVATLLTLMGRRTLLELHSPVDAPRARAMFRLLMKSRSFLGLVVITRALADRFVKDFGPSLAARVHVLPDAARPVRVSAEAARPQAATTVGYVGGFLPGKGVELVLAVAALLPELQFELVGGAAGDVPQGAGGIAPNVRFMGRLPHAQAMARIDACNVVLLPNQRKVMVSGGSVDIGEWTSPLKLFEYMAAGKPIVASRLPVLQEVLVDGQNCRLADPENPREWADRISELARDPDAARALGSRAQVELLQHYSWSARVRKMLSILRPNDPT